MPSFRPLALLVLGLSVPALAQRTPPRPGALPLPPGRPVPAAEKAKDRPREAEKEKEKPAAAGKDGKDSKGGKAVAPAQKSCEEVRRKARFGIYFDKVELEKLVQTVSDATCKTFILPENVRGKISIIGPENGKVDVDAEQFYAAFLAALDSNGLTVYPHGRFLKIVDKNRAKQTTIPTVLDPEEAFTTNEQMITRLFRIRYTDLEPLRGVLQQLVTKDGDTIPFQPDTLIVNDIGSNMHRLSRIVEQLDRPPSTDQIRVLQLRYATAQEMADKIQKLFESKAQRPGSRPGVTGAAPPPSPSPGAPPGGVPAATEGTGSGGPATLSQLIPDERTNKLIIIASAAAFERIQQLVDEIDIPISGEGRVNVYYLENAAAEDLANTLQSLAQGSANKPKTPPAPAPGGAKGPVQAAELFSGEVKISADKATNSLVIIASQSDYRNLVRVIEKLDIPRRQVFVEAVIMEVNLDRNTDFGLNLHTGLPVKTDQGTLPAVIGTKYTKSGLPPSFSLANLASFGGFLAGLQGPAIPELEKLGLNIPAFGVVMNALQQSSDVNVLSTPHILTSDNEEAEITVGQNVPFQAGFSPSNLGLGGLGGLTGSTSGLTGGLGTSGLLGGLGGLGSMFAPINRQNVELKLSVKPQINESDYIRLVVHQQTEEIASQDAVLGPTTAKRSAKTTVVAKDQETVVIGGIMQDRTIESVSKVPVLGDVPVLGHLFRQQSRKRVKTNLLLFLTPYIIKEQADFRRIFERKMAERQAFVEQFYGSVPNYEVAIDFSRKAGPLARINQVLLREQNRLENGGPGDGTQKLITPQQPAPDPSPAQPAPAPAQGTLNVPPPAQPAPLPADSQEAP